MSFKGLCPWLWGLENRALVSEAAQDWNDIKKLKRGFSRLPPFLLKKNTEVWTLLHPESDHLRGTWQVLAADPVSLKWRNLSAYPTDAQLD